MRMRLFPCYSLGFRFKVTIHHDGVSLRCVTPGQASGFAAYHGRPGINGDEFLVPYLNPAAIRDFFHIDAAVSISETRPIPACAKLTFLPPISRYPREGWLPSGLGRL